MAKQTRVTHTALDSPEDDDFLNETTPLLPNTSIINYNDGDHDDERVNPRAYHLLPALAIGCFLGAADQTIVTASYGAIGSEMNALNKTTWLVTAYLLPLSSIQLLYGTLSTTFGSKPLLLFAYITFGVGCLLCGLAQTMNQLIVARAITGLAGGFNTQASIILSEIVPLKKRGVWQAGRNLVYAVGLSLGSCGGWITETIGWRWSFLLQVPVVFIGFLNVCFSYSFTVDYRKESLGRKLKRVDFAGAILIIAAVASLLVGFDRGSNVSWTSFITHGCLLASITLFVAFFYVEIRIAVEPFAPASVLLNPSLAACSASGFFIYGAWLGILYYIPLFWQAVEGLSATQASLRLLPGVTTGVFGSLLAGLIIERTGRYYRLNNFSNATMLLGAILLILCTGLVTDSFAGLLVGYMLCGFTLNVGATSTLIALMASSSVTNQPAALSCLHLFRSLGSEIGIALCGAALQGVLQHSIRSRLPGDLDVDDLVDHVRKSLDFLNELDPALKELVKQCYALAVRWCLSISTVFVLSTLMAGFWIREQEILVNGPTEAGGGEVRSGEVVEGDRRSEGNNGPIEGRRGEGNV